MTAALADTLPPDHCGRRTLPRFNPASCDAIAPRTKDFTAVIFAIDVNDPTPLYAQLERAIRLAIATGGIRPGDKLPTVRQLAVELKINANTVAKVYAELERGGMLETRRGVGTFIRRISPPAMPQGDAESLLGELADRYLADAIRYGFSAEDAITFLNKRQLKRKREHPDG